MPHYSPERKEALQKMAPPHSLTVAELASQEGISAATACTIGVKPPGGRGAVLPSNSAHPDKWSSEEKFRIVLKPPR